MSYGNSRNKLLLDGLSFTPNPKLCSLGGSLGYTVLQKV